MPALRMQWETSAAMSRFFLTAIKIIIASLFTGAVLSWFNLSPEQILREVGIEPETMMEWLNNGAAWAVRSIVLGAIVIVPAWFVVQLFRPPRG